MTDLKSLEVRQQMAIRRPAANVFAAFADPNVTTEFWFNRSSGPLAAGAEITWYFDIYNVAAEVRVLDFQSDTRILLEWGSAGGDDWTTVDLTFEAKAEDRTLVTVVNKGFKGDDESILATALDSMGGFSLVLAAAKAWLEHGVDLKIVEDKF